MSKIKEIHDIIKNLSTPKFVLLMALVSFMALLITYPIYSVFPINYPDVVLEKYKPETIGFWLTFDTVIIAPIKETFIYQTIPIALTIVIIQNFKSDYGKTPICTPIIVSAFLFGMLHYFSYWYSFGKFVTSFAVGIVLAYSYIVALTIEDKPYWKTVMIHGLYNLICMVPTILIRFGII